MCARPPHVSPQGTLRVMASSDPENPDPTASTAENEILYFYNRGLEEGRLQTPYFRWERLRTLDLMERFLPRPPATVLDVGGGAGAYAFPLAEEGYIVDLVDPVPLHIEQARKRLETAPKA